MWPKTAQFRAEQSDRLVIFLYDIVDRPKFATVMYVQTVGRFNTCYGYNPDTLCQFL
jgi:hypothetical protein